jgi:hypothetical protein
MGKYRGNWQMLDRNFPRFLQNVNFPPINHTKGRQMCVFTGLRKVGRDIT